MEALKRKQQIKKIFLINIYMEGLKNDQRSSRIGFQEVTLEARQKIKDLLATIKENNKNCTEKRIVVEVKNEDTNSITKITFRESQYNRIFKNLGKEKVIQKCKRKFKLIR